MTEFLCILFLILHTVKKRAKWFPNLRDSMFEQFDLSMQDPSLILLSDGLVIVWKSGSKKLFKHSWLILSSLILSILKSLIIRWFREN